MLLHVDSYCYQGDILILSRLYFYALCRGTAQVRAGATVLFDSDPDDEEQETRLKASAFLEALARPRAGSTTNNAAMQVAPLAKGVKVLLVDHEDSFVHTLANYMRQTGADVTTLRPTAVDADVLSKIKPQLLFLSPGPGSPTDFKLSRTIDLALAAKIPIFGVCLGLQVQIHAGPFPIIIAGCTDSVSRWTNNLSVCYRASWSTSGANLASLAIRCMASLRRSWSIVTQTRAALVP